MAFLGHSNIRSLRLLGAVPSSLFVVYGYDREMFPSFMSFAMKGRHAVDNTLLKVKPLFGYGSGCGNFGNLRCGQCILLVIYYREVLMDVFSIS